MHRLILLLFSLCLCLPAAAERKQSFGNTDVHYSVFNSSFLQPDIAAAVGLVRSKTLGVLNVAVLDAGKPSPALVSGNVSNLLGQVTPLNFQQVREGEALYYLAQFPFSSREVLKFDLKVQDRTGAPHSFSFTQEVFPDQ